MSSERIDCRMVKWMTYLTILQLPIFFILFPSTGAQAEEKNSTAEEEHEEDYRTETGHNDCQRFPRHRSNKELTRTCRSLSVRFSSSDRSRQPPNVTRRPRWSPKLLELSRKRTFAIRLGQVLLFVYAFDVLRALVVYALNLNVLADFRYIDCLAMGRPSLIGLTQSFSALFGALFHTMYAVYRLCLTKGLCAKCTHLKFQVLEFLLHDYDEILTHEAMAIDRGHLSPGSSTKIIQKAKQFQAAKEVCKREQLLSRYHKDLNYRFMPSKNPLFYIRNSFLLDCIPADKIIDSEDLSELSKQEYILRPNRTSGSWLLLNKLAMMATLFAIMSIVVGSLTASFVSFGNILTRNGFEVTYKNCVQWIRTEQSSGLALKLEPQKRPYSYIYVVDLNKTLACDIPLDQLPFLFIYNAEMNPIIPVTGYQLVRVIIDLAESYVFYIGFAIYLCTISYIMFSISVDIALNAREIRRRLENVVERLDNCQMLESQRGTLLFAGLKPSEYPRNRQVLTKDILIVQEILVDHFKLIKDYNPFINFTLMLMFMLLMALSVTFLVIILGYRSPRIALEYFIGEIGSIVLIVYLIAGLAVARSLNCQLYPLVSRALALDSPRSVTKLRWGAIMEYYSRPNVLYCFTMLDSVEISWLFILKFSGWSLTALLLLAGFMYSSR